MIKLIENHFFDYHIKKNDLKLLIELYMQYKHTLRSSNFEKKEEQKKK